MRSRRICSAAKRPSKQLRKIRPRLETGSAGAKIAEIVEHHVGHLATWSQRSTICLARPAMTTICAAMGQRPVSAPLVGRLLFNTYAEP